MILWIHFRKCEIQTAMRYHASQWLSSIYVSNFQWEDTKHQSNINETFHLYKVLLSQNIVKHVFSAHLF